MCALCVDEGEDTRGRGRVKAMFTAQLFSTACPTVPAGHFQTQTPSPGASCHGDGKYTQIKKLAEDKNGAL